MFAIVQWNTMAFIDLSWPFRPANILPSNGLTCFDFFQTDLSQTHSGHIGELYPHHAAAEGSLQLLKEMAASDQRLLFKQDHNGWRPLHEAARAGRVEVVEYLLEQGADVNERTNQGDGGSPLWWAEKKPKENAKTIAVLKKYNGVALVPKSVERKQKEENKDAETTNEVKAQE